MNKKKVNLSVNRRKFLEIAGIGAMSMAMSSRFAFAGQQLSDRKVKVAIVGGGFGAGFHFHEHPNCIVEAVSDLRKDRRDRLMQVYKCKKSYGSLELLLKDANVEAVFIATPAIGHSRHVIETLKAGKHVLCAVPAAMTLDECDKIKDAVERSGLTYMMAETTAYRQNTISAKKFYKAGDFGTIFSAAAEYNHPGLETYFFDNGKPTWRHGLPPMLYPTHCTSFLIAVTGERLTSVSCLGWGDDSPVLKNNPYKNPFWNETAFFKTNKNTPFRVEVNWKGALKEAERGEWRGSKMSLYSPQQGIDNTIIVRAADAVGKDDAGFKNKANTVEIYKQPDWWETELPQPLRHSSGHGGSHTYITHEFIDALVNNRQPEVNIYEALAYTAPGIVAHQSALKNGEYMKIPSFDK